MFIKDILRGLVFCFWVFYSATFNAMAEDGTIQMPEDADTELVVTVIDTDLSHSSLIQRCKVNSDSEEICQEIYNYSSEKCSTMEECVWLVGKQIDELTGIHEFLQTCEADEECQTICRKIYDYPSKHAKKHRWQQCMGLPWKQVRKLKEIYEAFKNPEAHDLWKINPTDLKVFVAIDSHPLKTLLERLNVTGTGKVLSWIVEKSKILQIFFDIEEEVSFLETIIGKTDELVVKKVLAHIAEFEETAEIFKDEDDEYKMLLNLLVKVRPDVRKAIGTNISDDEKDEFSFMEKAIEDGNKPALDWIHDFFTERCVSYFESAAEQDSCVFKSWYCKVNLINDDHWKELLGYENFEDIIDTILYEYKTDPLPEWWDYNTEANDLETEHVRFFCDMNLQSKNEISSEHGAITNITPITRINRGQIVYYAGLGRDQGVETLAQRWRRMEGQSCNVKFGAELETLDSYENNQSVSVKITDEEFHGEGGSRLCKISSRFFSPRELLSKTKPVFTPYDYLKDYALTNADDFSKDEMVNYSGTEVSHWVEIKNALDFFDPNHDFYSSSCMITRLNNLKIIGFSQNRQWVLLEVVDGYIGGDYCLEDVHFILPTQEISKARDTDSSDFFSVQRCEMSEECKEICRLMYGWPSVDRSILEECMTLSGRQVERGWKIYEH